MRADRPADPDDAPPAGDGLQTVAVRWMDGYQVTFHDLREVQEGSGLLLLRGEHSNRRIPLAGGVRWYSLSQQPAPPARSLEADLRLAAAEDNWAQATRALSRVVEALGMAAWQVPGEGPVGFAELGEQLATEIQRRTSGTPPAWTAVEDAPGPAHRLACWVYAPPAVPRQSAPVVQIAWYDGAWHPGTLLTRSNRLLSEVTHWADITQPDPPAAP